MRRLLIALFALALLAPPALGQTRPVNSRPLSDAAAAKRVEHSSFEPRPGNRTENRHVLAKRQLATFKRKSDMPYKNRVSGRFRGTTDEIIQWAAAKHGLDANVLRAVAVIESYWRMTTVGDGGDSFGLFQIRRPFHCCATYARTSTAFNADYYGAIIRAYYDGKMPWLNDVEHGEPYKSGDLYGSLGAWFAGRWHTQGANEYIARVRDTLALRTWRTADFRNTRGL
jgi:hypothetical protein